ncbi:MAG: hydroxyisourate hydrolase [Gammaproteobacteria bacterium]|nr:hydroxyisourate hydrolase [Gammaproteobacteria bacterium]
MATVSSHTLNGVDGSHAAAVRMQLKNLATGAILFDTATDVAGRLSMAVDLRAFDVTDQYEMICWSGEYWASQDLPRDGVQIMQQIVLRFTMPNVDARYHIPLILNPNSYSCWWSLPE